MGSLKKNQPISPAVWPAINLFFLKKIAGVVPGPRQSHPSALPLTIRISITSVAAWLVRLRHVLFLNPGCKRTRVKGYQKGQHIYKHIYMSEDVY